MDLPFPAEGIFLSQTPAPNAKNVKPTAGITIVHSDGKTAWTAANVTLKFDGAAVTPTFTKDGNVATIAYTSSTLLASKSTHTITLGYSDPGGQPATQEWSFEAYQYTGPTKDTLQGYAGLIVGNAQFTADAGGHTGKAGDYAIDSTPRGGGWVDIADASFLNAARKNDTLSVSVWVKKYDIVMVLRFGSLRAIKIAFFRRILLGAMTSSISTRLASLFAAMARSIESTRTSIRWPVMWMMTVLENWHHFVFTKKADQKNIYIDGQLFLNGSSTAPHFDEHNRNWPVYGWRSRRRLYARPDR